MQVPPRTLKIILLNRAGHDEGVCATPVEEPAEVSRSRGLWGDMEFVGELAVAQQRLAACRDLVARRLAVLEALAVAPGEQVLEAGCGSGLLLRDIGASVGEQGLAVGIDVSPAQLTTARSYCKDTAQVQARVEDIRAVAAADEVFDATVCVQVLEYVPDVETAASPLCISAR